MILIMEMATFLDNTNSAFLLAIKGNSSIAESVKNNVKAMKAMVNIGLSLMNPNTTLEDIERLIGEIRKQTRD